MKLCEDHEKLKKEDPEDFDDTVRMGDKLGWGFERIKDDSCAVCAFLNWLSDQGQE